MFGADSGTGKLQIRRLALLAIGLVPIVWVALTGLFWLHSRIPEWIYWQAGLWFLIALEIAYATAVVLALIGIAGLGLLLFRGRLERHLRIRAARRSPPVHRADRCAGHGRGLVCGLGAPFTTRDRTAGRRRPAGTIVAATCAVRRTSRGVQFADEVCRLTRRSRHRSGRPGRIERRGSSLPAVGHDWKARRLAAQFSVPWTDGPTQYVGAVRRHARDAAPGAGQTGAASRAPDHLLRPQRVFLAPLVDRQPGSLRRRPHAWRLARLGARFERRSPLCTLIRETADKCRVAIPPSSGNARSLIDVPVYTAAEFEALLLDFRQRWRRSSPMRSKSAHADLDRASGQ